ncbi:MAG: hypothetical protein IJC25_05650, partial [Clostridia bacterium]|nr:hypothetical protein [Clostridia bacterium]
EIVFIRKGAVFLEGRSDDIFQEDNMRRCGQGVIHLNSIGVARRRLFSVELWLNFLNLFTLYHILRRIAIIKRAFFTFFAQPENILNLQRITPSHNDISQTT